jgi:hypothetical protein
VVVLIDGVETGVELTAIMAASAEDIVLGMHRLAKQKHQKYDRRGLFGARPMILLGHLSWPAIGTKERENVTMEAMYEAMAAYPALWDDQRTRYTPKLMEFYSDPRQRRAKKLGFDLRF